MFSEHGFNALIKFIMIVLLAQGLGIAGRHFFGWEDVAEYVFCFFLLTYLINFEKLDLEKKQRQKIENRLRGL